MNIFSQQLPCPVCKTSIPFDTRQLIAGMQFTCPNCQSSIGLAVESKAVVEETMRKFDELKKSTSSQV